MHSNISSKSAFWIWILDLSGKGGMTLHVESSHQHAQWLNSSSDVSATQNPNQLLPEFHKGTQGSP